MKTDGEKILDKKNWDKNFFWGLNMYQAKSGVISFSGGGGVVSKNQNCSEWSETWSCFGIFEISLHLGNFVFEFNTQAHTHAAPQ